ncbi:unnamed protein product [Thlaspi arvense]|uniref:Uncharacterized protein n=1 Tax=Thlaspi arvense TaxID=13288 RepID=A0AAU9SL99_THLAR|nr:unnamed protein product [Thlaspi arvense]
MEKTSLKLVFLFSLTVILLSSSLGDARDMAKEEVNCIGGKCPEEIASTMDTFEANAYCRRDKDCIQFCPKGCKIVNCNFGTCFCEC